MKTEFEKMRSCELYRFDDREILASLAHAKDLCRRLQTMTINDDGYRAVVEELIPGLPASSTVCPPFHCDHGNGITIGENVFVNYDAVMLDGGSIRIGNNVQIGPKCQLYTPQHPIDHVARREPQGGVPRRHHRGALHHCRRVGGGARHTRRLPRRRQPRRG